MSNIVANIQKKSKRLSKPDRKKAVEMINNNRMGNKMLINFQERILPNTMYIDVKASTMKIGNTTQSLGDISAEPIAMDYFASIKFLAYLKTLTDADIHKVILDNGDGFKVKSLEEFTGDIERYITEAAPSVKSQLPVEPTSYGQLPEDIQINMTPVDEI